MTRVYTVDDVLATGPSSAYTNDDAALLRRIVGGGLTAAQIAASGIMCSDLGWVLARLAPPNLAAEIAIDIAQRTLDAYWTDAGDRRPQDAIDTGRAALADHASVAVSEGRAASDAAWDAGLATFDALNAARAAGNVSAARAAKSAGDAARSAWASAWSAAGDDPASAWVAAASWAANAAYDAVGCEANNADRDAEWLRNIADLVDRMESLDE